MCFKGGEHTSEGMDLDAVRCQTGSPQGRLFSSNLLSDFLDNKFGINLSSLGSKKAASQGMSLPGEGEG